MACGWVRDGWQGRDGLGGWWSVGRGWGGGVGVGCMCLRVCGGGGGVGVGGSDRQGGEGAGGLRWVIGVEGRGVCMWVERWGMVGRARVGDKWG